MVIRPVEFWFSYSDSLCIRAAKLNALIVNAARGGLNRRRMDNIAAERSPDVVNRGSANQSLGHRFEGCTSSCRNACNNELWTSIWPSS
jgi:hypothetical protein